MATTVKRVGVVGLEQLDEATSTASMSPGFVDRRWRHQEPVP